MARTDIKKLPQTIAGGEMKRVAAGEDKTVIVIPVIVGIPIIVVEEAPIRIVIGVEQFRIAGRISLCVQDSISSTTL